jgi:TPR repeat protein
VLIKLSENQIAPADEYEDFIDERVSLIKCEQDLLQEKLEHQIGVLLASEIFDRFLDGLKNGNELCKNYLENFNPIFQRLKSESKDGVPAANETIQVSSRLLVIVRNLLKTHKKEIEELLLKQLKNNKEQVDQAIEKVLKITEKDWELSLLFFLNIMRLKRNADKFLKLAQEGDTEAQCKIGRYYIKGFAMSFPIMCTANDMTPSGKEGLKWLTMASQKNDRNWSGYASYRIALAYEYGQAGIPQSYEKARLWLEKAIEQDYYPAIHEMAIYYYEGLGVEKNIPKYLQLLKKAAYLHNYDLSQLLLAQHYLDGAICTKNINEAKNLLKKAAARGRKNAEQLLKNINEKTFN